MPDKPNQEIKLFYCYAREDKALRDELEIHLSALKRQYCLTNWSDREILPGENWEHAIDQHLSTSDLILLLISPDFMASDYCYGKEMQRALERHQEGTCRVIPILLRPVYWEAVPFSFIQMLPTDAKPITRWSDRDEGFHDVVKGISATIKAFLLSSKIGQKRDLGLAVSTETHPGTKRKHELNEDSLFAIQGVHMHNLQLFGLFVVADGMGSHANGQDASRLAIQNIIDFMLPRIATGNDLDDEGYKSLLMESVYIANLEMLHRNSMEHTDMRTTVTIVLVIGSTAYIANVGDSRTYLFREPEGLRQITRDHSVVTLLVDAEIIKPDDIYTHPQRNQIYRRLGEKYGLKVDAFIQPLKANDKLLLCSDGLWKMVNNLQGQLMLSTSISNSSQIGKNLVKVALDRGGDDNVSVIVVSITEDSGLTDMTGIHLHTKPDSVIVPEVFQR